MPTPPSPPPKPLATVWRPELTRLPQLHWRRRLLRAFAQGLARLVVALLTRADFRGLEHLPSAGRALIVVNHLGDADAAAVLAALPVAPDALGKIELLHEFPALGKIMDWYGTIWLHRGRPDRRALGCALEALEQGRQVVIAPEGRYTLVQGLEQGGDGAAWLAIRAHAPIFPVALTGTQNDKVYGSLRRLHRPRITLTAGPPFRLEDGPVSARTLSAGTQRIMETLACLLPREYRGVYSGSSPA